MVTPLDQILGKIMEIKYRRKFWSHIVRDFLTQAEKFFFFDPNQVMADLEVTYGQNLLIKFTPGVDFMKPLQPEVPITSL
jgi:hypothetical protein